MLPASFFVVARGGGIMGRARRALAKLWIFMRHPRGQKKKKKKKEGEKSLAKIRQALQRPIVVVVARVDGSSGMRRAIARRGDIRRLRETRRAVQRCIRCLRATVRAVISAKSEIDRRGRRNRPRGAFVGAAWEKNRNDSPAGDRLVFYIQRLSLATLFVRCNRVEPTFPGGVWFLHTRQIRSANASILWFCRDMPSLRLLLELMSFRKINELLSSTSLLSRSNRIVVRPGTNRNQKWDNRNCTLSRCNYRYNPVSDLIDHDCSSNFFHFRNQRRIYAKGISSTNVASGCHNHRMIYRSRSFGQSVNIVIIQSRRFATCCGKLMYVFHTRISQP